MNALPDMGAYGDEPWHATIERTGRWWWYVTLQRGLIGLSSGWFVFGSERRAEKLAPEDRPLEPQRQTVARPPGDLVTAPCITWLDRLSPRRRFWRMIEIRQWAAAEVERTRAPACDRPSCYGGPDTTASRIEHGCVPDWRRP